jgi:predicted secreted Zn-dependent protease
MSAIISCNPGSKPETKDSSASKKEAVPDTVVQFLITSAAADFHSHQPPTPIDFRNVRIGYTTSKDSEKIFVLCGEFLSQEGKQWSGFTTIKTSGYEQYLGETKYCQDAIMVLTDKNLSVELKNRLTKK